MINSHEQDPKNIRHKSKEFDPIILFPKFKHDTVAKRESTIPHSPLEVIPEHGHRKSNAALPFIEDKSPNNGFENQVKISNLTRENEELKNSIQQIQQEKQNDNKIIRELKSQLEHQTLIANHPQNIASATNQSLQDYIEELEKELKHYILECQKNEIVLQQFNSDYEDEIKLQVQLKNQLELAQLQIRAQQSQLQSYEQLKQKLNSDNLAKSELEITKTENRFLKCEVQNLMFRQQSICQTYEQEKKNSEREFQETIIELQQQNKHLLIQIEHTEADLMRFMEEIEIPDFTEDCDNLEQQTEYDSSIIQKIKDKKNIKKMKAFKPNDLKYLYSISKQQQTLNQLESQKLKQEIYSLQYKLFINNIQHDQDKKQFEREFKENIIDLQQKNQQLVDEIKATEQDVLKYVSECEVPDSLEKDDGLEQQTEYEEKQVEDRKLKKFKIIQHHLHSLDELERERYEQIIKDLKARILELEK